MSSIVSPKHLLAALLFGALVLGVAAGPAFAQSSEPAKSEKSEKKSAKKTTAKDNDADEKSDAEKKKLTPQQQKMKDCGAKWQAEKKAKNVKGKEAYQKFLSGCLKG